MNKLFRREWLRLIDSFTNETPNSIELLNTLLRFLRETEGVIGKKEFLTYGLDCFASLRAEDYPIEFTASSEAEIAHLVDVLKKSKDKPLMSITQLLRDILEQLLVLESDRECPRCGTYGMGVFKNNHDGSLLLMCRVCGRVTPYSDASTIKPIKVVLATIADLKEAALIP